MNRKGDDQKRDRQGHLPSDEQRLPPVTGGALKESAGFIALVRLVRVLRKAGPSQRGSRSPVRQ